MLPLEINKIENENDWHLLKGLLLSSRYQTNIKAREAYNALPQYLKENEIGKQINKFIETGKVKTLDKAAIQLTQRNSREAWLLIERL